MAAVPKMAGFVPTAQTTEGPATFARTFVTRARTFGFAARFLPPARRQAATALYAFCRVIDDLADELPPEEAVPALNEWVIWLRGAAAGQTPPPPSSDPGGALSDAVLALQRDHDLQVRYLVELAEGAQRDATRDGIEDFPELREFCYRMAGTVGLAMCAVLGANGPAARRCAERLGIAMQLTNVLRDVGEDLGRGRVSLPRDELRRFGVAREALAQHAVDERFEALMRFQVARARAYYATGTPGIFLLPRECRLGILVASRLYAAILTQIERQKYDVFSRRASTSTADKALTAARAYLALTVPPGVASKGGPWLTPW